MQKKEMVHTRTIPEKEDLVSFAENVSSVGAGNPSKKAKEIMRLYADGVIDLKTSESEIRKLHNINK